MKRLSLLGFAAVLMASGCGNDPDRADFSAVTQLATIAGPEKQAVPDPSALARGALSALKEPVMLAVLESRQAVAILVPLGENGSVRTWTTIDRQTISMRGGVIVATRGLGRDLMSTRTPGLGNAIRTRSNATFNRVNQTLNAANETDQANLTCSIAPGVREDITLASGQKLAAQRLTEKCTGAAAPVQNLYWVDQRGVVRQSRQWVGPEIGYLTLQLLRVP